MQGVVRIGELELRPQERRLLRQGREIALGARAFDLLLALVEHCDRVVEKDELMRTAWPRSIVEENNLTVQISALRKVLGPQAIRTVAGRGYQLTLVPSRDTSGAPESPALPAKPSIAVLPFASMGPDADAHLAQGMTEDVTTELCRFRDLFVVGHGTSTRYAGMAADVRDVGRELGVAFVLQGSVRRSDARVRLSVQLCAADSGGTVWAERYDDDEADLFLMQDRLTRRVVSSMVPELQWEEMRRVERGQRHFGVADDIAWRALKTMHEAIHVGAAQMALAKSLALEALRIDAGCVRALRVLGTCETVSFLYGWAADRAAAREAAREAARAHMRLAPDDSWSYLLRGHIEALAGDFDAGAQDVRRAHELNPNDALTLFILSWIEASDGNVVRARTLAQQALRQSPKDRWIGLAHLALAMCAFIEDDFDDLRHWAELGLQSQSSGAIRRVLMIAYAVARRDVELARMHRDAMSEIAPEFIPGLLRGEFLPFHRQEHLQKLLACLRQGEALVGAAP